MSLAKPLAGSTEPTGHRIVTLTVLFWVFSYIFLAMRGAMIEEQWTALLSLRRAIAVTAGAAAYWIVLKKLDALRRIELGKVVGWIVMATLSVMVFRLALDQLLASDPLPPLRNIRWSLAWSGYFGLWVMGAIAFRRGVADWTATVRQRTAPPATRVHERAAAAERLDAADVDWLVDTIAPGLTAIDSSTRREAAARILRSAGYELADEGDPDAERHNARVRVANRVAARLMSER